MMFLYGLINIQELAILYGGYIVCELCMAIDYDEMIVLMLRVAS